jgi:hypothetical protein
MKMSTVLLLILFSILSCTNQQVDSGQEQLSDMEKVEASTRLLRHVVLFKFKESASPADVERIEQAFSALPAKIDVIKDYEWGINNSPENINKGFTHCFFVTFDSEEGRAVYLPHPDHQAFVELLQPYLEDVLVLDYWTPHNAIH